MFKEINRKMRRVLIAMAALMALFELMNNNNRKPQKIRTYQTNEFDDMW